MFLKLEIPAEALAERQTRLDQLREHPLVAEVISSQAAPALLRMEGSLERLDSRQAISQSRLRGLREKRRDLDVDADAPHTGEIIVKYLDSESDTPTRLAAVRARVGSRGAGLGVRGRRSLGPDSDATDVLTLDVGADFRAVLRDLLASEDVEYAQPNYIYEPHAISNDYERPLQWSLPKISCPAAWDIRTDASSVIVAVVDSGVQYNHPDLAANMWINPNPGALGAYDGVYGADFGDNDNDPMDTFGHGTHVAGTIGAVGNNGIQITGVAWRTRIMALKVAQSGANGFSTAAIVGSLDYARLKGAHIVNASWGYFGYSSTRPSADPAYEAALRRLRDAGIVFVNSSGNDAWDTDVAEFSPSVPPGVTPPTIYVDWAPGRFGLPNMVVVNSSTQTDAVSSFSNTGRWSTDVFAPGGAGGSVNAENILSTLPGSITGYKAGTSMAAPHVTGMLALAKSHFPWETGRMLADRARFSIDAVASLGARALSGGRMNVAKALGARPLYSSLSTQCQVNTGHGIAIAGFVIEGPSTKRVAFRGRGPSLTTSGTLANPQMVVFNSAGQAIASNDDWTTLPAADRNELTAAGMAPASSLECAWIATLAPGAYTIHLSGVGGGTGVGMVEVFDADGSTQNRLTNLSTRCHVSTGSGIAIAGFELDGDKPRLVHVRVLGPTLASFGLPGVLGNPRITLFDSAGTQIAVNDDWRTIDGTSRSAETRLTEAGVAPTVDLESTLWIRLAPGAYTAQVAGVSNGSGIALVEINEL